MGDYKSFYKAMKFLKSISTASHPIKIRRTKISEDLHGYCVKKDDHFLIKIDKNLSEEHSIDIMLHEIAHADSWSEGVNHDIDWAVSFRRLYNLWEKSLGDNEENKSRRKCRGKNV